MASSQMLTQLKALTQESDESLLTMIPKPLSPHAIVKMSSKSLFTFTTAEVVKVRLPMTKETSSVVTRVQAFPTPCSQVSSHTVG